VGGQKDCKEFMVLSYVETDTLYPKQTNTIIWEDNEYKVIDYADVF
jgi:beta-galactosidase